MNKLTKKKAIEKHREMWTWLAEKTEERKEIVRKVSFFAENYVRKSEIPHQKCYCCEYMLEKNVKERCIGCCIIDWGDDHDCMGDASLYTKWVHAGSWMNAARLAREIAELPERNEKNKSVHGSVKG